MSGSWGCPHEVGGLCQRLKGAWCDPGMRGCVLDGKVTFTDGREHVPRWPTPAELAAAAEEDAEEAGQ